MWSKKYECCIECKTTEIKHIGKGLCARCYRKKHNKKYYEKNPEKVKLCNKKYYEKNPEKVKLRNKKWKEKNPEKVKLYNKKYREKNPEKSKLRNKKWREKNPEKVKQKFRFKEKGFKWSEVTEKSKEIEMEIYKWKKQAKLITNNILNELENKAIERMKNENLSKEAY